MERVLAGEVEALNDGAIQPDTAPPVSGRLRALLLLLAGRTHDAAALLGTADHSVDPAYRAVLPYLLAAGSRGPSLPQWATTRVAGLLRTIDEPWRSDWTSPTVSAHSTGGAPTLSDLPTARIAENAPTRPEQWLRSARAEIDRQVRAIVSGKHRRRYAEAARLAACCAEAYALAGDEAAGLEFISALRGDFSRHSAFRRELDTSTSDQPIAKIEPRR